jgi:hypothetical protein
MADLLGKSVPDTHTPHFQAQFGPTVPQLTVCRIYLLN